MTKTIDFLLEKSSNNMHGILGSLWVYWHDGDGKVALLWDAVAQ